MGRPPDRHRILLVALPTSGGVPQHVSDLVDCLGGSGLDLELICPPEGDLWLRLHGRPGVHLRAATPGAGIRAADVLLWLRMLRLVHHADVVHAHSSRAGFLVRSAALATGRSGRCVFTPHAWSFLGLGGWRRSLVVAAERLAARWCRVIVAVSKDEEEAGLVRRIGRPEQYRLIPNGVDLSRFPLARRERQEPDRVLVVSRLAQQKRPLLALEAFLALLRVRPSARMVFAGDGPLRTMLEARLATTGAGPAVEVLGHVDDVAVELGRASCLLHTSSYEGCPLSVIEAMAAGVPVVATRAAGTTGLVDDGVTGFAVDDDPEAIAAVLDRVLAGGTHVTETAERAQAVAHCRFSRDRVAAEVLSVYDEILAG